MGPALNGSSALCCFEHSNANEIRNGITFDFYPGLPHMHFSTIADLDTVAAREIACWKWE